MTEKKHVPLPKETKAFICANCGAVALDANKICKVQGTGKKVDWCAARKPKNRRHTATIRFTMTGGNAVNADRSL